MSASVVSTCWSRSVKRTTSPYFWRIPLSSSKISTFWLCRHIYVHQSSRLLSLLPVGVTFWTAVALWLKVTLWLWLCCLLQLLPLILHHSCPFLWLGSAVSSDPFFLNTVWLRRTTTASSMLATKQFAAVSVDSTAAAFVRLPPAAAADASPSCFLFRGLRGHPFFFFGWYDSILPRFVFWERHLTATTSGGPCLQLLNALGPRILTLSHRSSTSD